MRPRRALFVCIGNSCRSQMAEGFARKYGADVMTVASAGTQPATGIAPLTKKVMADKNIDLADSFPKALDAVAAAGWDVVINMSGRALPVKVPDARVEDWIVRDPIGEKEEVFQAVADQIEGLVMRLVLQLRNQAVGVPLPAAATPRSDDRPARVSRGFNRLRQ